MRFIAGLFAVLVHLVCSTAAQANSPFDQEVSHRRQRFATESARPNSASAVVPVLGLSALWDEVTDRALLREALAEMGQPRPTVSELVRAEAKWHEMCIRDSPSAVSTSKIPSS